jgi:2-(1,2-epoxy-1,2-dihydrophenyl)acetyl-CoA isomerase
MTDQTSLQLDTILLTINEGVATITLNRPDSANGMNLQMGDDITSVMKNIQESDAVRAIIITGNGKFFSAGGDLKAFAGYGDEIGKNIQKLADQLHDAMEILTNLDAPVINAVNGAAAGAGFGFSIFGDIVIAAKSASFTMAYTAAGLSPDAGGSYLLPRLIGMRKTQELLITNRRLSADEALDWGLVTEVVEDEELMEKANKLANRLARGPTRAFGTVKRLLANTWDRDMKTQLADEASSLANLAGSRDGQEGIHAFLEKRKPEFSGKD